MRSYFISLYICICIYFYIHIYIYIYIYIYITLLTCWAEPRGPWHLDTNKEPKGNVDKQLLEAIWIQFGHCHIGYILLHIILNSSMCLWYLSRIFPKTVPLCMFVSPSVCVSVFIRIFLFLSCLFCHLCPHIFLLSLCLCVRWAPPWVKLGGPWHLDTRKTIDTMWASTCRYRVGHMSSFQYRRI